MLEKEDIKKVGVESDGNRCCAVWQAEYMVVGGIDKVYQREG